VSRTKYILFIDESGDHGLKNIDPNFPVFVLSGCIFSEEEYVEFDRELNTLKTFIWNSQHVIFHSRDIRKCNNEFQVLFNLEKKELFYNKLNLIISNSNFNILSSVIDKEKYIKNFGKLGDVYSISLSFIIECAILFLKDLNIDVDLEIIVEKRGKLEDNELLKHYNEVYNFGTGNVSASQIKKYNTRFKFKSKKENINGLQLADLVAYPIARYILEPKRVNLAFDIIENKIYSKMKKKIGLKIFP
jgi:hypothetical protein